jgi:hypothetical protein
MEHLIAGQGSLESKGHLTCSCGRTFFQQSALSKHQKACQKSKKRLSSALDKAKSMWSGRKRRRLDLSDKHAEITAVTLVPGAQPSSAGLIPAASQADQEMADYEVRLNGLYNC